MSYIKCSNEIENLLKNVYYQYYLYQSNNKKESDNDVPVVMKKILKYQYVVNRYNTLATEEKRRKKEEELKQVNQVNKKVKKEKKYNYNLKDLQYLKANEEYIRAHVYDVLDEALKMKEKNQKSQGKKILEELESWLIKNDRGKNNDYIFFLF